MLAFFVALSVWNPYSHHNLLFLCVNNFHTVHSVFSVGSAIVKGCVWGDRGILEYFAYLFLSYFVTYFLSVFLLQCNRYTFS